MEKLIITQEKIDNNRKEELLRLIHLKMTEITKIPTKCGLTEIDPALEMVKKAKSLEELLDMYIKIDSELDS